MRTETATPQVPTWTIGDRMAKAREFAKMTQDELADAIGSSRRSIARYEASEVPPKAVMLAYSVVTGVPVWWLQGLDPDSGSSSVSTWCWSIFATESDEVAA